MLIPVSVFGQTPPPFDVAHAKVYFDEARALSDKDGGKLWGRPLYGALFFVDGQSRSVIANERSARPKACCSIDSRQFLLWIGESLGERI